MATGRTRRKLRRASLLCILLLLAPPASATAASQAHPTAPPGPDLGPVLDDPWWPEWLAHHDRDGDRVDDGAQEQARQALAGGRDLHLPVLVNYDRAVTERDGVLLESLGFAVLHRFTWIPTLLVAAPAAVLDSLGTLPGVVAVEWDRPLEPLLDVSAPATQALEAPGSGPYDGQTAEALGYTGEGMVVAVVDTGVHQGHPDFVGKWVAGVQTSLGSTTLTLPGQATPRVLECIDPVDDHGHGTHVAGIALGSPADGIHRGTAPGARLVEIKIDARGSSFAGSDELAFEWVLEYNQAIEDGDPLCGASLDDRIDVATMSFGTALPGGPNAGTMEAVLSQLASKGVVVTISAGNIGGDQGTISSPGNAAAAISVGNSDDRGTTPRSDDAVAASSSRGPNQGTATGSGNLQDRHRKPDLAAPGSYIMAPNNLDDLPRQHGIPGGPYRYVSKSGTSMAAPHVAGIAALLLQAGEEASAQTGGANLMRPTGPGFDASGTYVPGEHPVRDALVHGADYRIRGVSSLMLHKWEGPNSLGVMWNNGYGYGHVNAFGALCWAWEQVLAPGGATAPAAVSVCTDRDGDGVADADDALPGDPAEWSDGDGDGVGDNGDACPGFDDGVDTDGDGVPNGCESGPVVVVTVPADGATVDLQDDLTVSGTYTAGDLAQAGGTAGSCTGGGHVLVTLGASSACTPIDTGTDGDWTVTLTGLDLAPGAHALSATASDGTRVLTWHNITVDDGEDTVLYLHGSSEAVVADLQASSSTYSMSSTAPEGPRSYYTTVGSWDVDEDESPYLPTFVGRETVTVGATSVVRLHAYLAYFSIQFGIGCSLSAQVFDAAGTPLDSDGATGVPWGGATSYRMLYGHGHDAYEELVFILDVPAGTYEGMKVQFGNAGVGCNLPADWTWGAAEVPARLVVTDPPPVPDRDGDGVPDAEDAFPDDPTERSDRDGDGVGDNRDAFPGDPAEWSDGDGDGVGDNGDAFPGDPTEWSDGDGDGVGDNGDACPGFDDGADADGDGTPDGCEDKPASITVTSPSDGATIDGGGDLTVTGTYTRPVRDCIDCNGDGFVVISVQSTGINPYHADFSGDLYPRNLDADPHNDIDFRAHPSRYLQGFPADAPPIQLTLDGGFNRAADDEVFSGISQRTLYWIPGTKIIGAIDVNDDLPFLIVPPPEPPLYDEDGEGTRSASVAAGNLYGGCKECLLVAIKGPQSDHWAQQQDWIDIVTGPPGDLPVSSSMGIGGNGLNLGAWQRVAAERGQSILYGAGDGYGGDPATPDQTYTRPTTGPGWTLSVGAVDNDPMLGEGDHAVVQSAKPVDISAHGMGSIPAACHDDAARECRHSGTPGAAATAAGHLGAIILKARTLLGDTSPGTARIDGAGVVATGTPVEGNAFLDDGVFTRAEAWHVLFQSASPLAPSLLDAGRAPTLSLGASPADPAYVGYGVADATAQARALRMLEDGVPVLRDTRNADAFFAVDREIRRALWGSWDDDAETAPVPAPVVPTRLADLGLDAADAATDVERFLDLYAAERGDGDHETEALGRVGDVRVSNDDTALHIELAVEPSDLHPIFPEQTVSYSVYFTTHHNLDMVYRIDYNRDLLAGESFRLNVVTDDHNGLQSACMDGELSGSGPDPVAPGTYVVRWVVPFDALVHTVRPAFQGCAALQAGGEPLDAGDVLTDIRGAASLRFASASATLAPVQGEPDERGAYTVQEVAEPTCTDGGHILVTLGASSACTPIDTAIDGDWSVTLTGLDLAPGTHMVLATVSNGARELAWHNVTILVPPSDQDGDGAPDAEDAFPSDPTEWSDADGDGVGDNGDACPGFDDTRDADGDGIPDACDDDMDGDGRSNESDPDADGDGHPDVKEGLFGTDPRDPASQPDGLPPVHGGNG